ncbi:ATP-binding protein [Telmatospirillum siberiense]|uniref:histidine kinase n=1 Tax=Telmatospirillum siberiense TaxID=382514 RepID=A0A2N3Q1R2_9PROT|nr:ATP-binding protein [Telmatospirillum siberiense]PKU26592.1 hypothetical protein CWS72_01790 [Telmatospirillum siberiense]
MFKSSIAKLILFFQWASISALLAAALYGAAVEWRAYREASRILQLTETDRVLFNAVTTIRFEVGTHGVALLSLDDPRRRITESTHKVDFAYLSAAAAMANADIPERGRLMAAMDEAYRNLQHRHVLVGELMSRPLDTRDIAVIEPWRQAIFTLAARITDASVAVGNTVRMLDTTVAELVEVRRVSYAIRDRYGRPCSDLRGEIQRNQPLSQSAFVIWRQDVDAYLTQWRTLDSYLKRSGAAPQLIADVAEGRQKTAEIQRKMDAVILGLDGSPNPAMPAADWSNMCVSAYGAILKVGYDALDLAIDHAQEQKTTALLLFIGAMALLGIVLFLGAVIVLAIRHRLSGPMATLVAVIGRLSHRDFAEPVPPMPFPDELAAMAGALENLRIGALTAERLQTRLDEARKAEIEKTNLVSKAKSDFLATMSHEVRTPLNGVLGMVQLLRQSPLSSQQREWLNAIADSGNLLFSVLNDILDYSKIEAGQLHLESVAFCPQEVVDTVCATMAPQAAMKRVAFDKTLPARLPALLRGDPAKLSQILLNLIGNAVKFTPSGRVALHVRLFTPEPEPGPPRTQRIGLEFEVSDTGIGIAPEAIPHLFEAFSQSDSSITRRFGGTGLGLAICKRFIEAMEGNISVVSAPGLGSAFTIRLPFARTRRPRMKSPKTLAGTARLAILIAEDNEVNAMVARAMLERMGHSVAVAQDGLGAVALASERDFDLIMMDLAMPNLDGLSATRQIRALPHPTRRHVPIIALTANASQSGTAECFAAGMTGFLGKPFRQEELDRAVADAMRTDRTTSLFSPPAQSGAITLLTERADDLGIERAGKIVAIFRDTTPPLVDEMRAAMTARNPDGVESCAHRLKSAAANVGLDDLVALAAATEKAAALGDAEKMARLAQQIVARTTGDIAALSAIWESIVKRTNQPARQKRSRPRVRSR